jgi:hypothetical protein
MKMRFRTDGWHFADLKNFGYTLETYHSWGPISDEDRKEWDAVPKAEPGDVWRIHWHHNEGEPEGAIAGYAICCPGCGHIHSWTTAGNCNQKVQRSYVDTKTGQMVNYESCVHSGVSSCWNWSGSAEEGTLTAAPSLQVTHSDPDCHWHGFIQNGDIHT